MLRKISLLSLVCVLLSFSGKAQTGNIRGKITDAITGEELIGAAVIVEGTTTGSSADLDGNFSIEDLEPGSYNLVCRFISYGNDTVKNVVVKAGEVTVQNFNLHSIAVEISKEVVVSAKANRAGENYLMAMQKKSATVMDGISAEQIKARGDGDVASAVKRVTGVSVQDGKYIYVRGLSDRYSLTTLNDAQVPSLDPQRNSVQLDLFPTNLIDNIVVIKTFTPEYPGNWAGGLVNISTKDFPEKLTIQASATLGYNTNATGNDQFLSSQRSRTDYLGYDNGFRDIPAIVRNNDVQQIQQGSFVSTLNYYDLNHPDGRDPYQEGDVSSAGQIVNEVPEVISVNQVYELLYGYRLDLNKQLSDQTKSFSNTWDNVHKAAPMNQSYSFSIGNQTKFFKKPFGFNVGVNYSKKYNFYNGGSTGRYHLSGNYDNNTALLPDIILSDNQGQENVLWGALANGSYKFSPNSKIGLMVMRNQSGINESRYQNGINPADAVGLNLEQRIQRYLQRGVTVGQLKGEQYLPNFHKMKISWLGSYTYSTQNTPDLRLFYNSYNIQKDHKHYYNADGNAIPDDEIANIVANGDPISDYYPGYTYQVSTDTTYSIDNNLYPSPTRYFRKMHETNGEGQVNFELPFNNNTKLSNKMKFGVNYVNKGRAMREWRYSFIGSGMTYNGNPTTYFSPDNMNIAPSTPNHPSEFIYLRDDTENKNSYTGHQKIFGAYAMTDVNLSPSLRLIAGARLENTHIDVVSEGFAESTLNDSLKALLRGNLDLTDILPAASLSFALTEKMNLRLAASRTLARPTFRELGPFSSFDQEFLLTVTGNPQLTRTLIWNGDLRWELFPNPGEMFAISGFYKYFTDPIEMVYITTQANDEISWQNLDNSYLYGMELEGKKNIFNRGSTHLNVGANVSLIKAISKVSADELVLIRANKPDAKDNRDMYGQSPYLVNAYLSARNDSLGLEASISFNVQGKRLVLVNKGATPNIYEQPRPTLDLSINKSIGKHWTVTASGRNLLDSEFRRTYDFKSKLYDYQRYKLGRTYSLGLKYNL